MDAALRHIQHEIELPGAILAAAHYPQLEFFPEHRVARITGIAGKIELGGERGPVRGLHLYVDMRRATRIPRRHDGTQPVAPLAVRELVPAQPEATVVIGTFGVSLPADGYGVVKNNVVNMLKEMPNSFGYPTPGPARPEQFFKA